MTRNPLIKIYLFPCHVSINLFQYSTHHLSPLLPATSGTTTSARSQRTHSPVCPTCTRYFWTRTSSGASSPVRSAVCRASSISTWTRTASSKWHRARSTRWIDCRACKYERNLPGLPVLRFSIQAFSRWKAGNTGRFRNHFRITISTHNPYNHLHLGASPICECSRTFNPTETTKPEESIVRFPDRVNHLCWVQIGNSPNPASYLMDRKSPAGKPFRFPPTPTWWWRFFLFFRYKLSGICTSTILPRSRRAHFPTWQHWSDCKSWRVFCYPCEGVC